MLDAKTALRRLAQYAYARLERERPRVIAQRSHRGKERTLRVLRPAQLLDSEAVPHSATAAWRAKRWRSPASSSEKLPPLAW